jgi:3-oxoacyl-[acyl-carrier-protein] synthase-3
VTNHDLACTLDTSDEWIRERTGIRERHIAAATESTSGLALRAAQSALEVADLSPEELDLIIVGTVTPDYPVPSTACLLQDALGASGAAAFDLAASCSGFVYGLTVGSQMIQAGSCRSVLVVGADIMSRVMDATDRNGRVLFGDGAGAFVLQASDQPGGVLSSWLGSDGSGSKLLIIPAGVSRCPASPATVREGLHYVQMSGREVFRFATQILRRAVEEAVARAGLGIADIDLVIPHQANLRIIQSAARALDLPLDKFFVNIARYGNTSAASIPIAVCDAVAEGRLKPGARAILVGFGAGLTWGAVTVQWVAEPSRLSGTRSQRIPCETETYREPHAWVDGPLDPLAAESAARTAT